MKSNFLHVGYHKTGTSWMQKFLFPEIFKDKYIGKPFNGYDNKNWSFLECLNDKEECAASNEWILKQNSEIENIASTLQDNLTNTKILISIRRQQEMFLSRFLHMSTGRFKIWDVDLNLCLFRPSVWKKRRRHVSLPLYWYYNFAETYRTFANKFGEQNVHFIIYENLFTNTNDEVERFLRFLGKNISDRQKKFIEKNASIGINQTKDHPKSPTAKIWDKEKMTVKKEIFSIIGNAYEKPNQEMSELINFDLSKYGYCK